MNVPQLFASSLLFLICFQFVLSGIFGSIGKVFTKSILKSTVKTSLKGLGRTSLRFREAAKWAKVNSKYTIKVTGKQRNIDASKLR